MKDQRIVLIGNYPPDRQESMERFAQMLAEEYRARGYQTDIWRPKAVIVGKDKQTSQGLPKWLGYLDKWVLYPGWLAVRSRMQRGATFHICDHSNAPYLWPLPSKRTVVTCHDVLAIRGALGFQDAYCEASRIGKVLQQYIRYFLVRAKKVACVSGFTLRQLRELTPINQQEKDKWIVVYNAFNAHFYPMSAEEKAQDGHLDTHGKRFLFHVGSNLERKNRAAIVRMLEQLKGDYPDLYLCLAGHTADEPLQRLITSLGLTDRVINIHRPSAADLLLLYNTCSAFVFPSFSEGFGWPIIEAQACGVPVITSKHDPMQEVSGGAALYGTPTAPQELANAYRQLDDATVRQKIIDGGLENIKRFTNERMTREYLNLHNLKY